MVSLSRGTENAGDAATSYIFPGAAAGSHVACAMGSCIQAHNVDFNIIEREHLGHGRPRSVLWRPAIVSPNRK